MKRRYKGLVFLSVLLRVLAVIAVIVGVGLSLWSLIQGERSMVDRVGAIIDIGGALLIGIVVYSFGEVISFMLDVGDARKESKDRPG